MRRRAALPAAADQPPRVPPSRARAAREHAARHAATSGPARARGRQATPSAACRACARRARAPPPTWTQRGETWRLLPWIEGTRWAERAATAADAFATARAFGRFLRRLDGPACATAPRDDPRPFTTPRRALAALRARDAQPIPQGRAVARRDEIEALFDRRHAGHRLRRAGGARRDPRAPGPQRRQDRERAVRRRERRGALPSSTSTPRCPASPARLRRPGALERERQRGGRARPRPRRRAAAEVFAALARGFLAGTGDALSPGRARAAGDRRARDRLRAGRPLPRRLPGRRPLLPDDAPRPQPRPRAHPAAAARARSRPRGPSSSASWRSRAEGRELRTAERADYERLVEARPRFRCWRRHRAERVEGDATQRPP